MAVTETTKSKHQAIRESYQKKWCAKIYKGIPIYSEAYIYLKLSEQFFLSPKTIENILYYRNAR
ncbi:MAG: hypothetical protein QM486_08545 [Flavobacteriaceae bacterium]